VLSIVDVLPVTGAGVTLISAGKAPRYVAASNDEALRFEQLQTALGEGPCQLAFSSGEPVIIPDLAAEVRFPAFRKAALADGLAAAFTFPLRAVDSRLGALDLYRDTTGPLNAAQLSAAQSLADVAAAYLVNARSRDELRAAAEQFRNIALHDPLTGLPNQVLLAQRLAHAAQRGRRSKTNAALMFADLDRFKDVNDTYGHHVGDQLLVAVAARLSTVVRPGDTLARLFGDEFVILCEDITSVTDVEVLAFAGPGVDISERLIDQADRAMYEAKRARVTQRVIDLRHSLHEGDRYGSLERDLRRALAAGELSVAYQPIVRTSDAIVSGAEALVRWQHRERGPVPALSIIEAAEASGQIGRLGGWVLETACAAQREWCREYPDRHIDLSVNVSATQLLAPEFATSVADVLTRTGMNPAELVLEVTESALIAKGEATRAVLLELNHLGIRLGLDDFGTGYSSLAYLHRLPIAQLKIDPGFITDIGRSQSGLAIVTAITTLAHSLGLIVTAEGVETQAQREKVHELGCELSQGFLYARPMPAEHIPAHLGDARRAARALPINEPPQQRDGRP
jgi:predicted signal transduction protein with EAL and GGDEF domain